MSHECIVVALKADCFILFFLFFFLHSDLLRKSFNTDRHEERTPGPKEKNTLHMIVCSLVDSA